MTETKRYKVVLTEEDKNEINRKLRSKSTPKTIIRRCRILLDLDEANGNEFSREQCAKRNGLCIIENLLLSNNSAGVDDNRKFPILIRLLHVICHAKTERNAVQMILKYTAVSLNNEPCKCQE